MSLIYLDYAAAAPADLEAANIWRRLNQTCFGNPSAPHRLGREAAAVLEKCRRQLSRSLATKPERLIFSAGATEANNLIIAGLGSNLLGGLACLATDHESVKDRADLVVGVSPVSGQPDWQNLKLAEEIGLLSLAGISHETGARQDIKAAVGAVKRLNAERRPFGAARLWLHVDGSQMATTEAIYPSVWGVDLLTLNGAKVGGPRQTGLIYRSGSVNWRPGWAGGSQESGWRPGTESVANAAALTFCLRQTNENAPGLRARLRRLQKRFESGLKAVGAQIVLERAERSPHITCAIFPGFDGERLLFDLERQQIIVGLGSACGGRSPTTSTLGALGYRDDLIRASLRFSFGVGTSWSELSRTLKVLRSTLEANRS